MQPALPTIQLGELRVSRLIAGSNQISGFSHWSPERDREMTDYFTVQNVKEYFRDCEANGITALVARCDYFIERVLSEYWREGGRIKWIAQTAPEMRDQMGNIRMAKRAGASAVFIHGGDLDNLLSTGSQAEVRERLQLIHSLGLPAGIAAHDPKHHLEAQELGLPLDFHLVCLYNLTGYRGRKGADLQERFEPEDRARALAALRLLERPCIAYKVLAANRLTPDEALSDLKQALRPKDGILMGMFPPDRPNIVGDNARRIAALSERALAA